LITGLSPVPKTGDITGGHGLTGGFAVSEQGARGLTRLVDELIEAAGRCGLEVRREKILREVGYRARGGACRLHEKDLLILDRDQPPADQIEILAEALRDRDLESLYLSPAARRVLQTGPERG
jgi:hypothetical protein